VITRFDRRGGEFLAFERDLTIRTFFRPNDGEAYFDRQLKRGRAVP
jgi:pyocin large subunit-like protein